MAQAYQPTTTTAIREAGEPVIQGVTVQLLKGATVVAITTTDGGGNYIFTQRTNGAGAGTGEPLVAGADYTINIPAGQTILAGTKSSATPASQPAVNSVDKITLDDGDKGLGIASADSTATVSAALAVGRQLDGSIAEHQQHLRSRANQRRQRHEPQA